MLHDLLQHSVISALLEQAKKRGDEALCNEIKRLSPVAWQHFNIRKNY